MSVQILVPGIILLGFIAVIVSLTLRAGDNKK